jgi:hypothetical protein
MHQEEDEEAHQRRAEGRRQMTEQGWEDSGPGSHARDPAERPKAQWPEMPIGNAIAPLGRLAPAPRPGRPPCKARQGPHPHTCSRNTRRKDRREGQNATVSGGAQARGKTSD